MRGGAASVGAGGVAAPAHREAIARYGINTVPAVIHQRIDHVHAYTAGLSAAELAPRSKAARELDALFAWITQGALL